MDVAELNGSNRVFFGGESLDPTNPHNWFGVRSDCNGAASGAFLGGTLRSNVGGERVNYCGASVVNDGQWHFGAVTKSGHTDTTVRVYADGARESSLEGGFLGPLTFRNPDDTWNVGAFRDGRFPTTVDLAEVVMWRRALSDAEVRSLHRRVALRVRVQLRSCSLPDCSDVPFASGGFVDPPDTSEVPVQHGDLGVEGRYVQLRATLESDIPGDSPELEWLQLEGERL
jgi:hypothetical protein